MIKDEILQLKIESVGMEGEGIARVDGAVVFVPMTLVGEVVMAKVTYVGKKFCRAKVIKVLEPSPLRRTPICPIFFNCGGCAMMHIDYDAQLDIKWQNVSNCMTKVAHLDTVVDKVVPCSREYEYRNKIQLPIANVGGQIVVGYYREKSHNIMPFDKCYLHGEWADEIITIFLEWANRYKLTAYDERLCKGLLRHLVMRKLGDTVAIVVVINGDNLPQKDRLTTALRDKNIKFTLSINVNKKDTNVIMTNKTICLYGKPEIMHEVGGVKVAVSPNSFMQINDEIAGKIYDKVANGVASHGSPFVLECYSGIGVLTNIMANQQLDVISCEIEPSAVENADTMACLNGNSDRIANVCGDAGVTMPLIANAVRNGNIGELSSLKLSVELQEKIQNIIARSVGKDIVAVLDPPRKGCDKVVLDAVMSAKPNYIYYVSCSPSTLARDLAILNADYKVLSITPYDMFPQSSHVETVVVLERR